jgi:hypothetical protein
MGDGSSQKLSLVYGEIDFFSFANILERSSPKQGDVFVDLGKITKFGCWPILPFCSGHGTGKGLICAALLYGPVLSKCYGVEIVPELQAISVNTVKKYEDEILPLPLFAHHRNCSIVAEEGDLLADEYKHWTDAGAFVVCS